MENNGPRALDGEKTGIGDLLLRGSVFVPV